MSRRKQYVPQRKVFSTTVQPEEPHEDQQEVAEQQTEQTDQQSACQHAPALEATAEPVVFAAHTGDGLAAFAELLVATKTNLSAEAIEQQQSLLGPHAGPVSHIGARILHSRDQDDADIQPRVLLLSWHLPGQPADVEHKVCQVWRLLFSSCGASMWCMDKLAAPIV